MSAILDPIAMDRLRKVLSLFDSDQEGERTGALAAGTRILHAKGLRWQDVEISLGQDQSSPRHDPPPSARHWRTMARELLRRCDELSFKEHKFVDDILQLPRLTPRQDAWLNAIAFRVLGDQPHSTTGGR